jgi:hypothetical protein
MISREIFREASPGSRFTRRDDRAVASKVKIRIKGNIGFITLKSAFD